MNKRMIAGAAALLVVIALVLVAVAAGSDGDSSEPKRLPIGATASAGQARDAAMAMPIEGGGGYGGVEYRVGKLPDLPDEADAWDLPAGVADVGRIADALGVDRKDVHAEKAGGEPWSVYLDQAVSSVSSGVGYACPDDAAKCEPPPDYEEPKRPEGMPTKDEARTIAEKMLDRLGVDLDGATVRVEDGFSQWMVMVDPMLDGRKVVGMTTSIGIGPHGKVVSANGWMGEPAHGDTYPLITVDAAVKRLQDQPRIMMGTARDVGASEAMLAPAPDCKDCPPPEPQIITITGATLGLQLYGGYEPNAPGYLVPTYLFTTDQPDSGELWQIAIEDKYLAPPPTEPVPEPGVKPDPGQTEPGSSGSGDGNVGTGGTPTEPAPEPSPEPQPAPAPDQPNGATTPASAPPASR